MAKVSTWQGTPHLILGFLCPACKDEHMIPVSTESDKPAKCWSWNGSVDKPTLQPSLLVNVGGGNPTVPICHSYVTDGKIQFLSDSTHELAGQTVEIPEYQEPA